MGSRLRVNIKEEANMGVTAFGCSWHTYPQIRVIIAVFIHRHESFSIHTAFVREHNMNK